MSTCSYAKGAEVTNVNSLMFGSIVYNIDGDYAIFTHEGFITTSQFGEGRQADSKPHIVAARASREFNLPWFYSGNNIGELLQIGHDNMK